ncbi:MAG: histidine kinase [Acidimicrobiales bacterium]|jgi:signal transduction histidine kinase
MVDSAAGTATSVPPASRLQARVLLPGAVVLVASVALVVVSLTAAPRAGHRTLGVVVGVAVLCTAAAGLATMARAVRLGWLVTVGALVAALAAAGSRLALTHAHPVHSAPHDVATVAALSAMAISVHGLLSLPDGVLGRRSRQVGAALWYAVALVVAVVLIATSHVLAPWPAAIGWLIAVSSTLPVVQARYLDALATGRQRMQWIAIGAVVAAELILVSVTLNLLVAWPAQIAVPAAGATVFAALGLLCAASLRLAPHADRLLVHLISILGFSVVVAAIYLIVVRGLGKTPTGTTDREVLGLSIVAAAIAAVGYIPARDRFARMATGFVYGAREAPDEVVRSFGSRLTRAIPMDELLLQLAESLRKTLALKSAEIYTGTGDVLELAVSVPDLGSRSLVISDRERPVITHAGVSGNAWASVWMPTLLDGRAGGPIRVAPICHGGELLGTIVVARAEGAVGFTEEDDRVLTDLARQVGLAFRNAQLDTALLTSLEELKRQADELRASRARIVASGDAERRRVERNLHDGAQQHLVALAVNLRLVKDIVVEDPEGAVEMLEELGTAVQDTIQELRELAHGIYPPLLVDSGLAGALRPVVNRSPLDIELMIEDIGRYEGDIEAAIYFCCLEALQNAGKYAQDAHVTVRIWKESGGLLFAVADNGPGFDVRKAQHGHGFVNMMDRLGAIGGSVRWESEVGRGTQILGSVPLS